jgi:hypothetical protein
MRDLALAGLMLVSAAGSASADRVDRSCGVMVSYDKYCLS